jgi:hypothetical protein
MELTEEEKLAIIAKYNNLKAKQAQANKKYYDKLYVRTSELPEEKRLEIELKKQAKRDYQNAKYQSNKEYYLEASRRQREIKKALQNSSNVEINQ